MNCWFSNSRVGGLLFVLMLALCFGANTGNGQRSSPSEPAQQRKTYPSKQWRKLSSPAEQGWSVERLAEAQALSRQLGSAAVMVISDGVIVAEWGDVAKPFNLRSMRKSLLSALIGMAVKEGKINLAQTVAALGINDKEGLTAAEKQATVADLLTARSGIYHPAAYETRSAQESRPVRGSHPPGSFFYYNNWDFNALGTIYERQAKAKIFAAFAERIAKPLQMEDFTLADTRYQHEAMSEHPAYLFKLSARDLARFGLLYLREGEWNGKRLISREWIAESTRTHVPQATRDGDYGYMWWVFPPRNGAQAAYAARGSGSQFLMIVPSTQTVIVHLTDVDNAATPFKDGDGWRLLKMIYSAHSR